MSAEYWANTLRYAKTRLERARARLVVAHGEVARAEAEAIHAEQRLAAYRDEFLDAEVGR